MPFWFFIINSEKSSYQYTKLLRPLPHLPLLTFPLYFLILLFSYSLVFLYYFFTIHVHPKISLEELNNTLLGRSHLLILSGWFMQQSNFNVQTMHLTLWSSMIIIQAYNTVCFNIRYIDWYKCLPKELFLSILCLLIFFKNKIIA